MIKAVIYARVSTVKQLEGPSIEQQLIACRAYAKTHEMQVVATFSDSESGRTMERQGLDQARMLFASGAATALVAYDHDRLSRSVLDTARFRQEREALGIALHYVTLEEMTHDRRSFEYFLAIVAEEDRERIVARMQRGKAGKLARMQVIGVGKPPFGYHAVGHGKNQTWVIAEDEAEVVRLLFHWYGVEYLGIAAIIRRLEELSIQRPADRTNHRKRRPPGQWERSSVYYLLRQSAYGGAFYHHRFVTKTTSTQQIKQRLPRDKWIGVPVPVIVAPALFAAVQARLNVGRQQSPRNQQHEYLLAGRVQCICGYRVGGKRGTRYLCNGHRSSRAFPCANPPFSAPAADQLVWTWLAEEVLDETSLLRSLDLARSEEHETTQRRTREHGMLQRQLADLKHERDLLIRLYRTERIADDEFDRHNAELSETLRRLETQLARSAADDATGRTAQLEGALAIVQRDQARLRTATYDDRRRFMGLMNVEIIVEWTERGHHLHVRCDVAMATLEL